MAKFSRVHLHGLLMIECLCYVVRHTLQVQLVSGNVLHGNVQPWSLYNFSIAKQRSKKILSQI